jgi:hypothetical protein
MLLSPQPCPIDNVGCIVGEGLLVAVGTGVLVGVRVLNGVRVGVRVKVGARVCMEGVLGGGIDELDHCAIT